MLIPKSETSRTAAHLAVLEVVQEDVKALRLDTVVLNDDARAANDLARVALAVDFAQAGPGAEHLRVTDLDEVDLVLCAERLDELNVLGLRARLNKHTEMRLALVERLGRLAQPAREPVVHERVLQDLLQVDKMRVRLGCGVVAQEFLT